MGFTEHFAQNARILIGAVPKSKILVEIQTVLENTHLLAKAQELVVQAKKLIMWMHGKASKSH